MPAEGEGQLCRAHGSCIPSVEIPATAFWQRWSERGGYQYAWLCDECGAYAKEHGWEKH